MDLRRLIFSPRPDQLGGFVVRKGVTEVSADVWGEVMLRDLILQQGRSEVGVHTNALLWWRSWR